MDRIKNLFCIELTERCSEHFLLKKGNIPLYPEEIVQVLICLNKIERLEEETLDPLVKLAERDVKDITDMTAILGFFVDLNKIEEGKLFFKVFHDKLTTNLGNMSLVVAKDIFLFIKAAKLVNDEFISDFINKCLFKKEGDHFFYFRDDKNCKILLKIVALLSDIESKTSEPLFKKFSDYAFEHLNRYDTYEIRVIHSILEKKQLLDPIFTQKIAEIIAERLRKKEIEDAMDISEIALALTAKDKTLKANLIVSLKKGAEEADTDKLVEIGQMLTRIGVKEEETFEKIDLSLKETPKIEANTAIKAIFYATTNKRDISVVKTVLSKTEFEELSPFQTVLLLDSFRKISVERPYLKTVLEQLSQNIVSCLRQLNILEFVAVLHCLAEYDVCTKELQKEIEDVIYSTIAEYTLIQVNSFIEIFESYSSFNNPLLKQHLMMVRKKLEHEELVAAVNKMEDEELRALAAKHVEEENISKRFSKLI